jgi:hypothetical protein
MVMGLGGKGQRAGGGAGGESVMGHRGLVCQRSKVKECCMKYGLL